MSRVDSFVVPLLAATWLWPAVSHATYSVVGVDAAHSQVGASGTSCIDGADVYVIYGSVPGAGVVVAQASFHLAGRERAAALLDAGTPPDEIIAALTDASFDADANLRQYAVADLRGRVAAFTGSGTGPFAADRQGRLGDVAYSVQGNILTGEPVLTQAAAAFEASGCDLAERLLRSLEAGAAGGQGDSRCTPDGIPSDSAFLQVDRENEPAGTYLSLRVPTSGEQSPLPELRALYDNWRSQHPCPAPDPPSGAGGNDGGGGGGANDGGSTDDEAVDDQPSCGCRAAGPSPTRGHAFVLLAAAMALRMTRQRASRRRPDPVAGQRLARERPSLRARYTRREPCLR